MDATTKKTKNKKKYIAGSMSAVLVFVLVFVCIWYVNDYYRADKTAMEAFPVVGEVTRTVLADGTVVFELEQAETGFIFYPGGKVEHTAYEPLLQTLAAEGVLCVLVEVPLRLAILDIDAAESIAEQYPKVENWYIGGHSLGGSAAAMYLEEHTEEFEGLILLGSYSTVDLSEEEFAVLSVYGSEDGVLNKDNYLECKENLPQDFLEFVIKGGCHAYFGVYGEQAGDGTPTISNVEQIQITVEQVVDFMQITENVHRDERSME